MRYALGRGLVRPPWEAGECMHSRVTGVSVFVWSMIPGVYVGFSFLARARGRVESKRRRERSSPVSWKEITAGERKYFLSSILCHMWVPP